jgi:choline dehydrogenase
VGYTAIDDHNAPGATGVGPAPANMRDGVRVSTSIAYLASARDRANLTVMERCLVDRVLFDGQQAVGVAFERDGTTDQVFGQRITLCGGTIGTPAVLLRSGVGPASDLLPIGITPVVDLPGVGANLIDHASLQISLNSTSDATHADLPLWQIIARCTAPGSAEHNDLQLALFSMPQQPASRLTVKLMRPRSRGTLRLKDADPHHQPDIRLNLATDPEDVRRLVEGIQLLLELAETPEISALHTERVTLDDARELSLQDASASLRSFGAAAAYVYQTVSHYVHPVGTARMGPVGDAGAVVDQRGCVHGVQGLYVADASIMPNIPRANTNLTCIMIGERIAEWMRLTDSRG